MNLIDIKNVTFQYPGAKSPSLRDVSLTIEEGDFIAIMGGNGSGKTTLSKLINGLIPHYYVGDIKGEVVVDGKKTMESQVTDFSEIVGYVYQDFENQLVQAKVIDDASYTPLNFGYTDYKERGKQALERVNLVGKDNDYIWELSGGQKHLLALAGAISLEPNILIVDEPVAQLDPQHAEEFYDVLKKLNEEENMTIIVIEHHTEFVAEYCKNVVLMDSGKVLWKKDVRDALTRVQELKDKNIFPPQVTQAISRLNAMDTQPLPIHLDEAVHYMESYEIPEVKPIYLQKPQSSLKSNQNVEKIAEIKEVEFSYKMITREKKKILKSVTLDVYEGDRIALVGNNGAGKSTLMQLMTGLQKPEKGSVKVKNLNTEDFPPEHFADKVTYIYQNPEEMFIEDSIRNDIEFYLKARDISNYSEKVDEIIEKFHLKELQDRDGRLMSGGQQRRASLAIGVAMKPSLILLDEPTANLDIATRKYITQFIQTLKDEVEAVVIATHDMQLVAEWSNRIIVMKDGQIIHDGNRESVFSNEQLLKEAGLKSPQILELSRSLRTKLAYSVNEFVEYAQSIRERQAIDGSYKEATRLY